MAARTTSRTLTRRRRKSVASSASNIEALPGESDERVLERGMDGRQAAHADTRHDELAVAVLGAVTVEPREHDRALDGELGQAEAMKNLAGAGGVVGLDAQLGAARGLQVGDRPLGEQLAEGHDGHVRADLLDLRQEM